MDSWSERCSERTLAPSWFVIHHQTPKSGFNPNSKRLHRQQSFVTEEEGLVPTDATTKQCRRSFEQNLNPGRFFKRTTMVFACFSDFGGLASTFYGVLFIFCLASTVGSLFLRNLCST